VNERSTGLNPVPRRVTAHIGVAVGWSQWTRSSSLYDFAPDIGDCANDPRPEASHGQCPTNPHTSAARGDTGNA
jgi:hypothetical protein